MAEVATQPATVTGTVVAHGSDGRAHTGSDGVANTGAISVADTGADEAAHHRPHRRDAVNSGVKCT